VVLAHGADCADWNGPLLTALTAALSGQGHAVLRYCCGLKEIRRQRLLERALAAAIASPYAPGVCSWLLAGGPQP
jgi:predicted alpha/beta-hydrolase family hydrolase